MCVYDKNNKWVEKSIAGKTITVYIYIYIYYLLNKLQIMYISSQLQLTQYQPI